MARVAPAAAVGAVCLAGLLLLTNELDVLALGTETARSLGLPVLEYAETDKPAETYNAFYDTVFGEAAEE